MIRRTASVGPRRGWWGGEAGACTESLGSETGDVGGGDDADLIIGQLAAAAQDSAGPEAARGLQAAASPEKRRRIPPALPALCMRAERRGGRLILTELRGADRARRDVFRAERAGGRLRLRFADDAAAAPHHRGEPDAAAAGTDAGATTGVGGAAAGAAVQHSGGRGSGGELCQVAAGAGAASGRVEVTPVMMGI